MRLIAILLLLALAACQSGSASGPTSGPYINGGAGLNSLRAY
jgi:hypothetical protein